MWLEDPRQVCAFVTLAGLVLRAARATHWHLLQASVMGVVCVKQLEAANADAKQAPRAYSVDPQARVKVTPSLVKALNVFSHVRFRRGAPGEIAPCPAVAESVLEFVRFV